MVEETGTRGGMFLIPRNPWAVLFQGIGILALGIVLVAWPSATIEVVLIAFGVFALAFGLFQVYDAISKAHEDRWWRIPLAVVSIAAGIIALAWPDATERIVLIIVGLWFIITGFIMMAAGLKLPKEISGRWVVIAVGVIALGFGIYLLVRPQDVTPQQVASAVVRLVGVFAIIEGLLMGFYSFLLRKALKIIEAGK
jgi:uncharacterized membrane protein HdeD (DUF308 family)